MKQADLLDFSAFINLTVLVHTQMHTRENAADCVCKETVNFNPLRRRRQGAAGTKGWGERLNEKKIDLGI